MAKRKPSSDAPTHSKSKSPPKDADASAGDAKKPVTILVPPLYSFPPVRLTLEQRIERMDRPFQWSADQTQYYQITSRSLELNGLREMAARELVNRRLPIIVELLVNKLSVLHAACDTDNLAKFGFQLIEEINELVSEQGLELLSSGEYWTAPAEVAETGFEGCRNLPELALRIAMRSHSMMILVVGPDSGLKKRAIDQWPVLRRALSKVIPVQVGRIIDAMDVQRRASHRQFVESLLHCYPSPHIPSDSSLNATEWNAARAVLPPNWFDMAYVERLEFVKTWDAENEAVMAAGDAPNMAAATSQPAKMPGQTASSSTSDGQVGESPAASSFGFIERAKREAEEDERREKESDDRRARREELDEARRPLNDYLRSFFEERDPHVQCPKPYVCNLEEIAKRLMALYPHLSCEPLKSNIDKIDLGALPKQANANAIECGIALLKFVRDGNEPELNRLVEQIPGAKLLAAFSVVRWPALWNQIFDGPPTPESETPPVEQEKVDASAREHGTDTGEVRMTSNNGTHRPLMQGDATPETHTREDRQKPHEQAPPAETSADKPSWDGDRLTFRGEILKEYKRHPANNQRLILDAFQAVGWEGRIRNPWHDSNKSKQAEALRKLNETLRAINGTMPPSTIRFEATGNSYCRWTKV